MSQRMKKEDILKVLSELKFSPEEFWVVSSGALVLRGIFPDAGDIDLAVTDRGLEELKENYSLKPKGNGWYQVSDCIECVCDGKKKIYHINQRGLESTMFKILRNMKHI